MATSDRGWDWRLGLAGFLVVGGAIVLSTNCALAQVTPDATLGAQSSTITPNVNIGGLSAERIDGGATRGTNLFHSFLEFNVGNGQRIYFANPLGIDNILSRVTGNNLSSILGTLGVDGGANLFLLNPNGITFGSNAKLDIAGSFVASTADSLVFENGTKFSARNPEAPPLLKISITPGVQYGTNQPRSTIANLGNLVVGQNLTFSAGNLDLQGQLSAGRDLTIFAQDTVRIRDSVANPFIAAAGGQLLVQGNQRVDIFALNHPNSGLFSGGNMVLRSANTVGGDAHYWSGGSFRIERLDGSLGSLFSPYDPVIRANGDVFLDSYTGASLHIFAGGSVTIPGTVEITGSDPITGLTDTVTLSNGETVSIDGESEPTLDVRAGIDWTTLPGDQVIGTIAPPIPVFGTIPTSNNITIGNIITDIVGGNGGIVLLTNQYQSNNSLDGQIRVGGIDTRDTYGGGSVFIDSRNGITITGLVDNSLDLNNTNSSGLAGDVTILAVGDISLINGGGIQSTSSNDDTSNGYSVITIRSTEGSVFLNQAELNTTNSGTGYAGDILIDARNQVEIINGSTITSRGYLGTISIGNIITPQTVLIDRTQISTTNSGSSFAGDISISATDQVSIENQSSIFSRGNFGRIFIGESEDYSSVSPRIVTINNATLNTSVPSGSTTNAGGISLKAESIFLSGATLDSTNHGSGIAGSMVVSAHDQVYLTNSKIISQSNNDNTSSFSEINITSTEGSVFLNQAGLSTTNSGSGFAGDIRINARDQVAIANGSLLFSNGWAGRVTVNAGNQVAISDSTISSQSDNSETDPFSEINITSTEGSILFDHAQLTTANDGIGYAGNIEINAHDWVEIVNGSLIQSNGLAGQVTVKTDNQVVIADSTISSQSDNSETDSFSEINIMSTEGSILFDHAQLTTTNKGSGFAGDIRINAREQVEIANGSLLLSDGRFGRILIGDKIVPTTVVINSPITWASEDTTLLRTTTSRTGRGGDISINASDSISITNSSIFSDTEGRGNAGNISIQTNGLVSITRGIITSEVIKGAEATGNGGTLNITARSLFLVDKAQLHADNHGQGNAGNIFVDADDSISVLGDSFISSGTFGQGNAGNISVQADNSISLAGSSYISTFVDSSAVGKGGNITITTGSLFVTNGAGLDTSTFGQGNAGNILIRASDTVSFDGAGSGAISSVEGELQGTIGTGNAGDINIQARFLSLIGGAEIKAQTWGEGNAGNIWINTSDSVTLSGVAPPVLGDGSSGGFSSGLFTSTEQRASGQGGNINITTPNLRISDGAVLSTRSQSDFRGGDIMINANNLEVTGGGQILSTAFNNGDAGNIRVKVTDRTTISGSDPTFVDRFNQVAEVFGEPLARILIDPVGSESGLYANTILASTGKGGSIFINSNQVEISNDAKIAVDSQGQGNGGNISIQADSLTLKDRASIVAQTASGEGGNLIVQVQDILLMRYNSLISAEAGGTGNGGNIDIDANFVVAVPKENSDIVANAFEGRGGNIDITTQGIFGIEFRELQTPLSDITASSQFGVDGVVAINTPGVDPSRGLAELPTNIVHVEDMIDRRCTAQQEADERSSFTITGRGGIPPSPNEPLRNHEAEIFTNWVTGETEENVEEKQKPENPNHTTPNTKPTSSTPQSLVEAQGWVYGPNGEIILTSEPPTVTPQNPWLILSSCQSNHEGTK